MSINLTYAEKYMIEGGSRGLRNQNEFLIDKSRHKMVDWNYLSKNLHPTLN